jgi:hypothetical protein
MNDTTPEIAERMQAELMSLSNATPVRHGSQNVRSRAPNGNRIIAKGFIAAGTKAPSLRTYLR